MHGGAQSHLQSTPVAAEKATTNRVQGKVGALRLTGESVTESVAAGNGKAIWRKYSYAEATARTSCIAT